MTEQEQLAEIKALVLETNEKVEHLEKNFEHLEKKNDQISQQIKEFDIRIDAYQKASQQVVNLAFGLIVAATASIIVPAIINR
jgi:predicted  nucleic acid-binding Zn-ribbon protein